MTGKELYQIWQRKQLRLNNCETEDFDEMEEGDQLAWDETAEELSINERANLEFMDYSKE